MRIFALYVKGILAIAWLATLGNKSVFKFIEHIELSFFTCIFQSATMTRKERIVLLLGSNINAFITIIIVLLLLSAFPQDEFLVTVFAWATVFLFVFLLVLAIVWKD